MNSKKKLFANNNVLRTYGTVSNEEHDLAFEKRFGKRYLEYRRRWDEASRSDTYNFPTHLDFELRDVCNQACTMCPRNTSTHPDTGYALNTKGRIDPELFRRIIDEGSQNGLASINLGAFAEPLINEQLFEYVSYAASKGVMDIRIITNGLLLEKYSEMILDSAITNLFVSIDATNSITYGEIRGKGFDIVRQAVTNFLQKRTIQGKRFPFVRVSFVEMGINADQKEEFVDYWSNIADFVDVQPGEDLSKPPSGKSDGPIRFTCLAPWQRMSILANGDVLPCCNFYGRYIPVGNAKSETLSRIWNSARMNEVRDALREDTSPVCRTCQRTSLL